MIKVINCVASIVGILILGIFATIYCTVSLVAGLVALPFAIADYCVTTAGKTLFGRKV